MKILIVVAACLLYIIFGTAASPNMKKITIRGQLSLKPARNVQPPRRSCVKITVQPFIMCSGDFPCNIPVYASTYLKNFMIEDGKISYEVTFEPERFPEEVSIGAVFNNGWCSENQDDWLRNGDYFNEYSQTVRIHQKKRVYTKNFEINRYQSRGLPLDETDENDISISQFKDKVDWLKPAPEFPFCSDKCCASFCKPFMWDCCCLKKC